MKFRRTYLPALIILSVASILFVRLAWRFSKMPLAWRMHRLQWKEAVLGLLGHKSLKLPSQEPEDQARFWLSEVARLRPAEQNAEVAAGSAWMLDAPGRSFSGKHFRIKDIPEFPDAPLFMRMELDIDSIDLAFAKFHAQCRIACLESIEAATRHDPHNVEWWRERALLLFDRNFSGFAIEPRRDDWLAVLKDCSQHDPDNALYDYLAALQLWSHSASHHFQDDGRVLVISDPIQYEQGDLAFASGQKKRRLQFGVGASAAAMRFIQQAATDPLDWLEISYGHANEAHAAGMLFATQRWHSVRIDVLRRRGDSHGELAELRAVLRMTEQWEPAGNEAGTYFPVLVLRVWGLDNLRTLAKEHQELLGEAQSKVIEQQWKDSRLESLVRGEAYKQLSKAAKSSANADAWFTGFLGGLQDMIVWLACIGVAAWGIASLTQPRIGVAWPEMGFYRHFAAWLAGYGISFLILGICPSGIIPEAFQTMAVRVVI